MRIKKLSQSEAWVFSQTIDGVRYERTYYGGLSKESASAQFRDYIKQLTRPMQCVDCSVRDARVRYVRDIQADMSSPLCPECAK